MSIRLNIMGGLAAILVVSGVWWVAAQQHNTPTAELNDFTTSPLCYDADGVPLRGSPTIAEGWSRTASVALKRAQVLYHGTRSLSVYDVYDDVPTPITFIRIGAHQWRPGVDPATIAWTAKACRSVPGFKSRVSGSTS